MKASLTRRLSASLLFALLFVLTACPGPTTPQPGGSLEVIIAGLPANASANVRITGPAFDETITSTRTLGDLSPGVYTLTASAVTVDGAVYAPIQASQTVAVVAGDTATATIGYERQAADAGSLALTITGLPEGVDANVSVTGPGGFSRSATSSQTFANLTPGEYTVFAGSVVTGGVSYLATPPIETVVVDAGATATATVEYAVETGTLQIDITGLPEGAAADVAVTGPGGFGQNVATTSTLANLIPGSYTVGASEVVVGNTTYIPDPASREITVVASARVTATVNYVPQPADTGGLAVTVSGLPGDVNADITVAGPEGFNQSVTSSQTLTNLPPGNYAVTAANVAVGNNVYVPSPASQTVTVTAGAVTTATVGYTAQPGNLQLIISGLPPDASANLAVTGPEGFDETVTGTALLDNLAPGDYVIDVGNVTVMGETYVPDSPSTTVTVTSNATAVATIAYAVQPASTGSLALSIIGLPEGVDAHVAVTGPGGYSQEVVDTTTLIELTPGDYTITADDVTADEASYLATPPTQSVTIGAGTTATAAVSYATQPGSLQLSVTGLPEGAAASITVTGADGSSHNVTGTTTLENLNPGRYTLHAHSVTFSGEAYVANPPSQEVAVASNETATAAVSYSQQPAGTGSLALDITGLPEGLSADVAVSGPGGYAQHATASITLTDLTPGLYTITAAHVSMGGAGYIAAPPSQTVEVLAGATARATVAYIEQVDAFALLVALVGDGSGVVNINPPDLDCEDECLEAYGEGDQVTLTAMADPGSSFVRWFGDCESFEESETCVLEMTQDMEAWAWLEFDEDDYWEEW
jgi:hypothetical protein